MQRQLRFCLVGLACLVAGLCIAYLAWRNDWYRRKIPAEVGTAGVVLIDGRSGFREGCGAAIFALDTETTERIRALGIQALAQPPPAPDGGRAGTVQTGWQETPYRNIGNGEGLEDRWLVGLSCADMERKLSRAIDRGLRQPGSYYLRLYESGVIVIPAAGIVVFAYEG